MLTRVRLMHIRLGCEPRSSWPTLLSCFLNSFLCDFPLSLQFLKAHFFNPVARKLVYFDLKVDLLCYARYFS